jgi:hypothetical protein
MRRLFEPATLGFGSCGLGSSTNPSTSCTPFRRKRRSANTAACTRMAFHDVVSVQNHFPSIGGNVKTIPGVSQRNRIVSKNFIFLVSDKICAFVRQTHKRCLHWELNPGPTADSLQFGRTLYKAVALPLSYRGGPVV